MAKLLLVNDKSAVDGRCEPGDIIGVFDDSHVFSERELAMFDFETVKEDAKTLQAALSAITPEIRTATRAKTLDWTFDEPEKKSLWKDGDNWKELVTDPKYKFRFIDGEFIQNFDRYIENTSKNISVFEPTDK